MKRRVARCCDCWRSRQSRRRSSFPTRPVTLIVPWPAGGSTDIGMRALAAATEKHLGQSIVIENKPGAAGTIGPANMAANARPDGYTVAQLPITVFRMPFIQKTTFDPDEGLHLHHPRHRLHVRRGGEGGRAVEDVPGTARLRQGQSRQDQLRHARRRHEPAHHHGADRQAEGHQVDAGAVQGRGRQHERAARRAHRRRRRTRPAGPARSMPARRACW